MLLKDKLALLQETIDYLAGKVPKGAELRQRLQLLLADLEDKPPKKPRSFIVSATIRSDDDNVSDDVEAAVWLGYCSSEMLAYLCKDTGANEDTDDLYWWLDGEVGEDPWGRHVAKRLGQYLNAVNTTNNRDTVGFSVRLNEDELHAWVRDNRPEAWKIYVEETE